MQSANVEVPITVTGRHVSVTDPIREYAFKKIEGLHLDYPRIIEAKAILDVEKDRHIAEIILYCANHITIEASSETADLYASIDETISKIARRMRKHKTKLLKSHRPRRQEVRDVEEQIMAAEASEHHDEEEEPPIVHRESYRIRPMFVTDALMEMELSERAFLLFHNAKNDRLSAVYRRRDGSYGLIEPEMPNQS